MSFIKKYELGRAEAVFIVAILVAVAVVAVFAWRVDDEQKTKDSNISSFQECKDAGNPIMESYPEQCNADGVTYTNPDQSAQLEPVIDAELESE